MEEAHHLHHHHQHQHLVPSSSASVDGPSTSSLSTSQVQEEEEGRNELPRNEDNPRHQLSHHSSHASVISYRINITISNVAPSEMWDDVWSYLFVLVTFWFFASMTLILGCYGSVTFQLGPNCSRLIKTNTLFVQSIEAKEVYEPNPGPILYGFHKPPPLDVETTWTETHKAVVPIDFHKEWVYFLNKGSKVDIFYTIKSSAPLSLVVAQGKNGLVEWIDDPSYPNSTLSWNIIFGSGKIEQEILEPSNYYLAVGNLNSEDVEVELTFKMKAVIYNTTHSHYMCSISNPLCRLKLSLFRTSFAVLTSPGRIEGYSDDDWHVKISYRPRWITYIVGSGIMTLLMMLTLKFCNAFQASDQDSNQPGEMRSERIPLLTPKDDDISSRGSSYDSISQDGRDVDELLAANSLEGKPLPEGENLQSLCVICFDAPRDCFFLPCGHCAACFACASRIAEEPGTCPICRRSMKKVRKIFTV
ncbi:hypothetical protein JCGZ_08465 [Jatropha curcas]|uniref:RING-type domain-containing protein n=1 Tax=Jatropha curcas TaxID=180498 RepID=A0A067LGL3_JATCU|nr:E3 ubiquitin-protein ligase APD2 [Jatropha curcas]KDP46493.1 hypothetical protein JCGZ_08465 [Jatropha curcas]